MLYTFIFYKTDESFDFGDFPGSTISIKDVHGFDIEIDRYDNVDLTSLTGFGNFSYFSKIQSLNQLKTEIINNLSDIDEFPDKSTFTNIEVFQDFIKILERNENELLS